MATVFTRTTVLLPIPGIVVNEPSHLSLLLARSMGAIPMCLRLRAGHIRIRAVVFGMDTDGGESL